MGVTAKYKGIKLRDVYWGGFEDFVPSDGFEGVAEV